MSLPGVLDTKFNPPGKGRQYSVIPSTRDYPYWLYTDGAPPSGQESNNLWYPFRMGVPFDITRWWPMFDETPTPTGQASYVDYCNQIGPNNPLGFGSVVPNPTLGDSFNGAQPTPSQGLQ